MKTLIIFFAFLALHLTSASQLSSHAAALVGPTSPGVILKGPAAASAIVGPDGSKITYAAEAGSISTGPSHTGAISTAYTQGYIAQKAYVPQYVAPYQAYTPLIASQGFNVASGHLNNFLPYAYAVKPDVIVTGPSGIIETFKTDKGHLWSHNYI